MQSADPVSEAEYRKTLLIVDDEENILQSLKRSFRKSEYEIVTTTSAREALNIIKEKEIGVIISDQRMPEMTGVELLSEVKCISPQTIRIVLSGYTELKTITEAINRGAIFKFLTKPWEDEQLIKRVEEAFEVYEMRREKQELSRCLAEANEKLTKLNDYLKDEADTWSMEMITHLKEKQLTEQILDGMPVGLIAIDNTDKIALINKSIMQNFNIKKEDCHDAKVDNLPSTLKKIFDLFGKNTGRKKIKCKDITYDVCLSIYGEEPGWGHVYVFTKVA